MYDFEGRVAIVTGAASGIGRATAKRFAAEGASVAVVDLVDEGAEETVRSIEDDGGEAAYIRTDVSDGDDVEAMVAETVETFGRLDLAHNNAGRSGQFVSTVDYPEDEWARTIGTNLTGVFLCLKHEIPAMLESGGGAVVNTASTSGFVGSPDMAAYAPSKHGVVGLTRTAALEFGADGVRVNAVCPGVVGTEGVRAFMDVEAASEAHPFGRIGEPEEIAAAVAWLCSEEASYVNGLPMLVDGGTLAGE